MYDTKYIILLVLIWLMACIIKQYIVFLALAFVSHGPAYDTLLSLVVCYLELLATKATKRGGTKAPL